MSAADQIGPAVRTLTRYYRTGVAWWAGFFAIVLVPIGLAARYGAPDRSLWAYVSGAPIRWVLLVMGLLVAPSLFRAMVAHGVTRRTFTVACGVAIGLLAVAVAVFAVVGFLVERALYAGGDHPTTVEGTHLFDSTGQIHLIFAEYALIAAAHLVTGWLIGVGFQRHWLAGIGFLPVALAPAAVGSLVLSAQPDGPWFPDAPVIGNLDLPLGITLSLALSVVMLGLLIGRWLLHPVPIKANNS